MVTVTFKIRDEGFELTDEARPMVKHTVNSPPFTADDRHELYKDLMDFIESYVPKSKR